MAPGGRRPALTGALVAGVVAVVAFIVANPYALLAPAEFWSGLSHQSTAAGDAFGKLGLSQDNGFLYYLWTFTWGLGLVPLLAAVGGVAALLRDERRLVAVFLPAPILFVLFMGFQERYFGRWLLPVFPVVCIVAAYGMLELADRLGRTRPAWRATFVSLAVVALLGQGVVYTLHSGLVLSRADTRNVAREWLVDNVPPTTKIVVEPVVPDLWAQDLGKPSPLTSNGNRWVKFPTSRSRIDPASGQTIAGPGAIVNIEDYERTLRPELIDRYENEGYCFVIVGSTQRGRAEVEPEKVPLALAYYSELERRSKRVYEASPYAKGRGPVQFNFDFSFDYYPLAYHRPGPVMTVYRLTGGSCAPA